ncbi:hypothetical protein Tco_1295910 [Tanacetum coccineum]
MFSSNSERESAATMWQAVIGQPLRHVNKWDPHNTSLRTGQRDGSTGRVATCHHRSGPRVTTWHLRGIHVSPRGIHMASDVAVENIAKPGLGQARTRDLG